ncbi:hypothetical protein SNK04_007985 [Fusarium graminearum]
MILDGSFFIAVKPGTHCQICFGSPVGTSPRLERKFNFHRLDESSWALYLPHFAPGQGDAGSGPWPTLDDLATPCLSLSLSWCLLTTAIESNYQAVSRRPLRPQTTRNPTIVERAPVCLEWIRICGRLGSRASLHPSATSQ